MTIQNGTRREQFPVQTRLQAGQLAPETYNKAERTIDVVWSTGAAVQRYDWVNDRYYSEVLSLDPAHVRLDRLNNGAPFLNSHQTYDLSSVLGVVVRAWLENGVGKATIRLSDRPDIQPLIDDIAAGIIRNISIGYRVMKFEVDETNPNLPIYRAVDWQPFEISPVTVGADPGAGTRAAEQTTNPCEFIVRAPAPQTMENEMTTKPNESVRTDPAANPQNPAPAVTQAPAAQEPTQVDAQAVRAAATAAERARVAGIQAAARNMGLSDHEEIAAMLSGNTSVDEARARMIDIHAARSQGAGGPAAAAQANAQIQVGASSEDPQVRIEAMAVAQAMRFSPKIQATDHAREFAGCGIIDLAKDVLRMRGVKNVGHAPAAIIDAVSRNFHTSSDFGNLLAAVANKLLLGDYAQATPTYRSLAKKRNFRDFKAHNFLRLGDFPTLLALGESGEIQSGTMGSSQEKVTLGTYGRKFGITRQALINDDLSAFSDLAGKAGRRVLDFENALFFALLLLNSGTGPTMADGNPFFHSSHANRVAGGTTIDVTNVAAGRSLMAKQTSIDGLKLNLAPKYLVVGPDRLLLAEQLTGVVAPNQASSVNPFSGRLQTISDANIIGNPWWLFADPEIAEGFIWGYLEGAEGPRIETRNGFTVEGIEMKIVEDFAVGGIDFRPAFYNPGN